MGSACLGLGGDRLRCGLRRVRRADLRSWLLATLIDAAPEIGWAVAEVSAVRPLVREQVAPPSGPRFEHLMSLLVRPCPSAGGSRGNAGATLAHGSGGGRVNAQDAKGGNVRPAWFRLKGKVGTVANQQMAA